MGISDETQKRIGGNMDVNSVVVIGRLTRDPVLTFTAGGTALCKFSIAVDDSYGSGDQKKESVYFFDVTVWGKPAEICGQYVKKGKQVCIQGKLTQDRWKDKNDGSNRTKVAITARTIQFLASPKDGAKPADGPTPAGADGAGAPPASMDQPSNFEDEVPF